MSSMPSIMALGLPGTRSGTALASMHTNLPVPTVAAAATTSLVPDGGVEIDLPWPPIWLTVLAFILTGAAVVLAIGVWMISWPPDDDDRAAVEGKEGEHMEVDEGEGATEWSGDEEDEETTWMMRKAFEDAVELKRLSSNVTPPPSPPLSGERGDDQCSNRHKEQGLRLGLSAAVGLGVALWERGDAGRRRCGDAQTAYHHVGCDDWQCKDDACKSDRDEEDGASLLSMSIASDADTEAGLVDSSISAGAGATTSSTTLMSSTSKPDFNRPLHGWRKAVDDRVGVLASWIEWYVADGGREKDLLCKIREGERGDAVCGFEI